MQSKKAQNFKRRTIHTFKDKSYNLNVKSASLVYTYKRCILHIIHFLKIKKKIKKIKKIGILSYKVLRLWVIFNLNIIISLKDKNARMGKGKGAFLTWALKCNKYSIIIRSFNVNIHTLDLISKDLTSITGIKHVSSKPLSGYAITL